MTFELKDLLYIIGIVASTIISFLGTRHNMKEYIRDKNDKLKDDVNDIKLEMKDLKSKDELQQQIIDQIGKQMDSLIFELMKQLKDNGKNGK